MAIRTAINDWLGFSPGESFQSVMARRRGVGPGFDLLRILLAVTIFAAHAKWLCGTPGMDLTGVAKNQFAGDPLAPLHFGKEWPVALWTGALRPIKLAVVPMFFALSGFLVMRSGLRLRSTPIWLAHRALRIFPALIVEVLLSAFILGPLFTRLPLSAYFIDPRLWRYFGNIVGDITYFLPDVFANNPAPYFVNMTLWTLQSEFLGYLIVAALMSIGIAFNARLSAILFAIVTVILVSANAAIGYSVPVNGPYSTHVIVYYCLLGVLAAIYADKIPAHFSWFVASIPLAYILLLFDSTIYLATLPLCYATLFFGLMPAPRLPVLSKGDYSYGIYLYGFPVTQALVAWWPALFLRNPVVLIPVAFLTTLGFAMLSWSLIEKHALKLKSWFPARSKTVSG